MIEPRPGGESAAGPCRDLRHDPGAGCWIDPGEPCRAVPAAATFADLVLGRCSGCRLFEDLRARASGRRRADRLVFDLVRRLADEVDDSTRTLRHARAELGLIQEAAHALVASRDRTEIVHLLLVAVTAGEGAGLNRAFLFRPDDDGSWVGVDAVGPADDGEAAEVYAHLRDRRLALDDLLRSRGGATLASRIRGHRLRPGEAAWLDARVPVLHDPARDGPLVGIPGDAGASLVVPLPGEPDPVGLLVADNLYTGRAPDGEDLDLVATLASQAAAALQRVELHERLNEQAVRLRGVSGLLGEPDPAVADGAAVSPAELAAQVLHGLKNSLVVIGGYSRWLRDAGERTAPELRALRAILAESEHLESVVATLLDPAGRGQETGEPVVPAEVLGRAADLEREAFARAGVRLDVRLDPGLADVRGDPPSLVLCLRSLLQNARHATPTGGRVLLAARAEGGGVRIDVGDSGPGLSSDGRRRAGEAFFTTKPGGTGLGLWLARRVAARHGGTFRLEDADDGGLLVSLSLPEGPAKPTRPDSR